MGQRNPRRPNHTSPDSRSRICVSSGRRSTGQTKGTNDDLRISAFSCEALPFSLKKAALPKMHCFPRKTKSLQRSVKICINQRLGSVCLENSPAPYRSLRALRARSAPGSVRESVSKNRGVPKSVWRSALGALLKVTEKCLFRHF